MNFMARTRCVRDIVVQMSGDLIAIIQFRATIPNAGGRTTRPAAITIAWVLDRSPNWPMTGTATPASQPTEEGRSQEGDGLHDPMDENTGGSGSFRECGKGQFPGDAAGLVQGNAREKSGRASSCTNLAGTTPRTISRRLTPPSRIGTTP